MLYCCFVNVQCSHSTQGGEPTPFTTVVHTKFYYVAIRVICVLVIPSAESYNTYNKITAAYVNSMLYYTALYCDVIKL